MLHKYSNEIIKELLGILKAGSLHLAVDPMLQRQQEVKQLSKRVRENLSDGLPRQKHKDLPHNDKGWWDDLSYDEQLSYLKAHRNSKFKITKHQNSEDSIEMTGNQDSITNKGALFKNHKLAIQKNMESTQFKTDEQGNAFAELQVGDATVSLDIPDWKKAMKQKLRLEKDPITKKMILKGEKFESRVTKFGIDENEKYRVLAGSLFGEGLKNWRMEYKDSNHYNLRRDNVLVKTYEAGIEDQIKNSGAHDVTFKRQKFDNQGITVEAPSFVPKIKIDGSYIDLGMGFPDAKTAMLAQDVAAVISNGKIDPSQLNFKHYPTDEDIKEIGTEDAKSIARIAQYGTPDRALQRIDDLSQMDSNTRDIGEDEMKTLARKMSKSSDNKDWLEVNKILTPDLPDDISKYDLYDHKISLLSLNPTDNETLFSVIRDAKKKEALAHPEDVVHEEPTKTTIEIKPERHEGESDDSYIGRVTDDLYQRELSNTHMPLKERYQWFEKNKEIYGDYELYMNMMRNLKIKGEKLFKEDKGGTRFSQKKSINIPILVYPSSMDFADVPRHETLFQKHKFRDIGDLSGSSERKWTIPGAYNNGTIASHEGGFSPATGRSFGPQAGFEYAKPKDGYKDKTHFSKLDKLGYPELMDKIWDEYDWRRRNGIDTLEDVDFNNIKKSFKHASLILREFLKHISL